MTTIDALPLHRDQRNVRVGLLGVGTAVPPPMRQDQVTAIAEDFSCDDEKQRAWLRRVFTRSGVDTRGSVLIHSEQTNTADMKAFYPPRTHPDDRGPTTATRMDRYAIEAPLLGATAARRALIAADITPQEITHLITVSCTGFSAPGLDIAMIQQLSLSPQVNRQHIGFMGCHAAFNALAAARAAVLADPAAIILVCCVELCSLHFAYGWSPGKLVANALFGDGAAAAILGKSATDSDSSVPQWNLLASASMLLPDSLDAMTWRIGNHGFEMTLSPELPALVQSRLRPWVEQFIASHNLSIPDIQSWAIHPGGPKILTAAAAALDIPDHHLQHSRAILAAHGNMSSTTILFILQQMAAQNSESPCVALGFGPGLMMEAMLLDR